jgi:DHA1 family bicyclomycin/chloramphenicol resistance-like MFS transporter
LIVGLLVSAAGMGLVVPSVAVLALEHHGPHAGSASALLGTIQLVTAAAVIAVVGLVSDGTVLPMVLIMAGCGAVALVMGLLSLTGGPKPAAQPAE